MSRLPGRLVSTLSAGEKVEMKLFIGEDIPRGKVRSGGDQDGVAATRLPIRVVRIGHRILPLHVGLIDDFTKLGSAVILCEGGNLSDAVEETTPKTHGEGGPPDRFSSVRSDDEPEQAR